MSVGSASICKAIAALWQNSGLHTQFTAYWATSDKTDFPSLNDAEAEGAHPFPYCVFELDENVPTMRMAGGTTTTKRVVREVGLMFHVHAKPVDPHSAKEIAATLAEEIVKVFGGHPTVKNQIDGYSLDDGAILLSELVSDSSLRENIENWEWLLRYKIQTDSPFIV